MQESCIMKISDDGKTLELEIPEYLDQLTHMGMHVPKSVSMLMALGLNASSQDGRIDHRLPGFVRLMDTPHELTDEEYEGLRQDFRNWIVGNGLTELFVGLEMFLNSFYTAIIRCDLHFQGKPVAKAKRPIDEFEKLGVWRKLRRFEDRFNFRTGLSDHFEVLNKARNCLTHRHGIIHDQDCNHGGELQLTWLGFDLTSVETDGTEHEITLDTIGPIKASMFRSEGNRQLRSTMVRRKLTFAIGDVISIPPKSLEEICFMSGFCCAKLHQSATNWLIENGVPANDGKPIDDPKVEVILELLIPENAVPE